MEPCAVLKNANNSKRATIDLATKISIIRDVDNKVPYEVIKSKYNLKGSSNISNIISKRKKYIEAGRYSTPERKTLKRPKYEIIDRGLKNFVDSCLQNGTKVNVNELKEKAIEIAQSNGIFDFIASNGYIDNFKRRSGNFDIIEGDDGSDADSSNNSNYEDDASFQESSPLHQSFEKALCPDVQNLSAAHNEKNDKLDVGVGDEEETITRRDAVLSIDKLKLYALQRSSQELSLKLLNKINEFENWMYMEFMNKKN